MPLPEIAARFIWELHAAGNEGNSRVCGIIWAQMSNGVDFRPDMVKHTLRYLEDNGLARVEWRSEARNQYSYVILLPAVAQALPEGHNCLLSGCATFRAA